MDLVLRNRDFLGEIFKFLDSFSDRFKVLLTCKSWHQIGEKVFDLSINNNIAIKICLTKKLYDSLEYILLDPRVKPWYLYKCKYCANEHKVDVFIELLEAKEARLCRKIMDYPEVKEYIRDKHGSGCLFLKNNNYPCNKSRIKDSIFCGPCLFKEASWWCSDGMASEGERQYLKNKRCRYVYTNKVRCSNHIAADRSKFMCYCHRKKKLNGKR